MADFWPAVISAGITCRAQNVDLVPAAWPMFMRPDLAGRRMDRQSLRVAVPDGENLWRPTRLSLVNEMRIAGVWIAIRRQADDAGGMR